MHVTLIPALATAASLMAPVATADDESQIRKEIQGYLEAWNSGDAEGLASFYAEDGDRANNRGEIFHGREAILAHYERVFATPPPPGVERRLVYHDVDVRVVSASAAVVDIRYEVSGINAQVTRNVLGRNTVFMTKHDGRWMRAAHRNSLPLSPACLTVCAEQDLLPWR